MAISELEAFAEILLLLLTLVPTGLATLRAAEWILRRQFALTVVERGMLAVYAGGGLLFILASIPLPLYDVDTVGGLLALGTVGYLILVAAERGRSLVPARRFLVRPIGIGLGLAFVGLLVIEFFSVATHDFPNAWDGSMTALWMNLTLQHHTLPVTLQPYATAGVTYPLGTTVWMTVPVLLFGWSVVSSPVYLPPLFLALSLPAAYCWGARLGAPAGGENTRVGIVFAAFFGLVASWPRFEVGGSYDFAFALPGLLVLFGMIRPLVDGGLPSWKDSLTFAAVAGLLTSVSLVAGEAILVVLLGGVLASRRWRPAELGRWFARIALLIGCELLLILRSLVGFLVWFSYPSHVLDQTGPPSVYPSQVFGPLDVRLIEGDLDPFLLFKPRLSPFPLLATELQVLLVLALALLIVGIWRPFSRQTQLLPRGMSRNLAVTTVSLLLVTAVSLLGEGTGWLDGLIGSVTSFDEASTLYFLSLQALALIPVLAAIGWIRSDGAWSPRLGYAGRPANRANRRWALDEGSNRPRSTIWTGIGVAVVLVPLASGLWITSTEVPGYLNGIVGKTSNVTSGDVAALRWVGDHLPACSNVLAGPGSAAQFLPEYAQVHLVFQMNPTPLNGSYNLVVENLTDGEYTAQTRTALEWLGVTEIFVTGQTSVSFLPLQSAPLASSPDFTLDFHQDDAYVFAFVPGIGSTGCPS